MSTELDIQQLQRVLERVLDGDFTARMKGGDGAASLNVLEGRINTILSLFEEKHRAVEISRNDFNLLQQEFNAFQEKSTRFKREQRKAERRLRANERQLKALINAHMGAAYLMTVDGIILAINEMTADSLGYPPLELTGKNIYDFLPVPIGQNRKRKTREVVSTGERVVFREERGEKIMKNSLYPISDLNGRVVQVAVFSYDITDEEKAIFENKLWTETFQHAPWGVALASSDDWRIITANPAFVQLFRGDPKELSSLTLMDLTAEIPGRKLDKLLHSALEKNKGIIELQQRRRDGSRFDAWISVAYVKGEAHSAGYFIINVQDVTRQKRLERSVFESEQMLRLVLDHIPSRVYWKDAGLNYLGCNKQYAEDVGLSDPRDILGKSDDELVWRQFSGDHNQTDLGIIRNDTPRINYEEQELNYDGVQTWLRSTKIPLKNLDGEVFGILGMYDDITKQRRVQRQLKESEERYRTLITDISEGFFITSVRGELTFANRSLAKILGYQTSQEIVGRTFFDFVVPEARDRIRQVYRRSVNTAKGNRRLQVFINRPDGSRRTLDIRPELIEVKGSIQGMRGIISDITEQQEIEKALRESEEQYRTLFERMNEGFAYHRAEFDENGKPDDFTFINVNRAFEGHTGLTAKQVINKKASSIFPNQHNSLKELITKFGEIAGGGGEERFETFFKPLNRWFAISVFSPRKGFFCTILEDISARKKLEADKEEQQQRLTQITENIRDVFWLKDWLSQEIIYVSPAFEKIWGIKLAELENNPNNRLDNVHDDDKEKVSSAWKNAHKGEYDVEYRIVRPDKEIRWVRDRGFPVLNHEGRVTRIAGLAVDISEEKAGRENLTKLNTELKRSNSELEQFAYVASHDLQEPLRKIQAFGDRLLSSFSDGLDEKPKDYLERMVKASGRMHLLVEDLLAFSRLTTRGRPFKPVDLNIVLKDVLDDLSLLIKETGAKVKITGLPTIVGDETQFRQLFQNLIQNSIKFRVPGKPVIVEVKRGSSVKGPYVIVKDNGIGFDNKFSERVFKIFQRLHTQSEYEGTGIGLAMCKKIMERHGGEIIANGSEGQGAEFMIRFNLNFNRDVAING